MQKAKSEAEAAPSGLLIRKGEVASLDGLRAVSVLLVMLGHSGSIGNVIPGGFGVTIFFFISGFIITTLLWREHERTGVIGISSFYVRRTLRLYPALLLLIVGVLAIRALSGVGTGGLGVAGALFYFTNYLDIFRPESVPLEFGHLWSLAVEMHFYLLYPLLVAWLIPHPTRLAVALGAIVVAAFLLRLGVSLRWPPVVGGTAHAYTSLASECRIDSIAFGALTAIIVLKARNAGEIAWLIAPRLVVSALMILVAVLLLRNDVFRQTARFSIQGLALMPVVAAMVLSSGFVRAREILNSGVLVFVGALSYSLYLWHPAMFELCRDRLAGYDYVGAMVVAWVLTFAAAALSYRLVELPMLDLRRRFGSEPQGRGRPLAVEAAPVDTATVR